jgi:XTP/dITP diphosphohydrolase
VTAAEHAWGTFVLASGNRGKLAEMNRLLADTSIRVLPQSEFGVVEVDETGLCFVENAILKAREASRVSGLPAIADDSGLEVDALDGAPGVRSSRFAGEEADDAANNQLLLERLAGIPDEQRRARFRCVIVCLRHPLDPAPLICEGVWEGRIAGHPSGEGGFGYDPLFLPDGCEGSAATLDPAQKNRLSHRGQALRLLVAALRPNR